MKNPTRWPIFEFTLNVWKLHLGTSLMCNVFDAEVMQYIKFSIWWGRTVLFEVKLYDLYKRIDNRKK